MTSNIFDPLGDRTGQPLNTNHLLVGTLAELPVSGVQNGAQAFATDGRKSGEGAGDGTGLAVWFDEASATWIDPRTTAAATA